MHHFCAIAVSNPDTQHTGTKKPPEGGFMRKCEGRALLAAWRLELREPHDLLPDQLIDLLQAR
ncbi:hypothetical protein, partial [Pseudomonas aeruginosa]